MDTVSFNLTLSYFMLFWVFVLTKAYSFVSIFELKNTWLKGIHLLSSWILFVLLTLFLFFDNENVRLVLLSFIGFIQHYMLIVQLSTLYEAIKILNDPNVASWRHSGLLFLSICIPVLVSRSIVIWSVYYMFLIDSLLGLLYALLFMVLLVSFLKYNQSKRKQLNSGSSPFYATQTEQTYVAILQRVTLRLIPLSLFYGFFAVFTYYFYKESVVIYYVYLIFVSIIHVFNFYTLPVKKDEAIKLHTPTYLRKKLELP